MVVGSRSALFAPLERLGLIVIDEEHEAAYKQEGRPTYHAREVAVRLGRLTGATVVLGSATPSVESYWQAQAGAYALLELRERAPQANRTTPPMGLATRHACRSARRATRGQHQHSQRAAGRGAARDARRGEQAILFLNRRGMASMIVCRECGYVARCTRCDISMTFHATEHAVICHYCGRKASVPHVCPICLVAQHPLLWSGHRARRERRQAPIPAGAGAALGPRHGQDAPRPRGAAACLRRASRRCAGGHADDRQGA